MTDGAIRRTMCRRTLLGTALALAAAPALGGQVAQNSIGQPAKPDIVVFLADDLGYLDTAPTGDRNARSPNLARLSKQSLSFDQAFVASPACAPSRAALLTGMMPARNGAEANHARANADIRKLPSYLQAQGYQVVSFGKVAHYEQTLSYGFDHAANYTYHDDSAVYNAIKWLKTRTDKRPLALFVGSNWPHVPWPASTDGIDPAALKLPAKTVDTPQTRAARARYYSAVARMDLELGDVMAAADAALGKDHFLLFSSDHGAQWPFGKWNLYDTGTRTPLMVSWPGHTTPNTRTSAMVSWVDILPTLVEVAGGTVPTDIDGQSFAAALGATGKAFAGRPEIFTTHNNDGNFNVYPGRAVRTDRWKYIRNMHPDWLHTTHIDQSRETGEGAYFPTWQQRAQTNPKARQIVDAYYTRPAEELYDIVADPDETRNLAGDPRHASVLQDLRARVERWRREQGDTHPVAGTPHLNRERTARDD
jgi:N-sulfoglucosamine sulfohydrolase